MKLCDLVSCPMYNSVGSVVVKLEIIVVVVFDVEEVDPAASGKTNRQQILLIAEKHFSLAARQCK